MTLFPVDTFGRNAQFIFKNCSNIGFIRYFSSPFFSSVRCLPCQANLLLGYLIKYMCVLSGTLGDRINFREHFLQHIGKLLRKIKLAMLIIHMDRQFSNQIGNAEACLVIEALALCADLDRLGNKTPIFYNCYQLIHHGSQCGIWAFRVDSSSQFFHKPFYVIFLFVKKSLCFNLICVNNICNDNRALFLTIISRGLNRISNRLHEIF